MPSIGQYYCCHFKVLSLSLPPPFSETLYFLWSDGHIFSLQNIKIRCVLISIYQTNPGNEWFKKNDFTTHITLEGRHSILKKPYLRILEFIVSLVLRRQHCRWRAANFDLWSAPMATEQWGFFSVPHLLWHGASLYKGHQRGPVTLTPNAESLTVELSLTVLKDLSVAVGIRTSNLPLAGKRSNRLHHRRVRKTTLK